MTKSISRNSPSGSSPSGSSPSGSSPSGKGRLLARLGKLAFLFFLLKGLAWLTVPALLAYWARS